MPKPVIKFIDLFAGIGGFHIAINKYLKEEKLKGKCVLVSEINSSAKEVYRSNFKYKSPIFDINDIKTKDIEDFDILFAGFPCQPFSNAGKKQAFKDQKRGSSFTNILRIIKMKSPPPYYSSWKR